MEQEIRINPRSSTSRACQGRHRCHTCDIGTSPPPTSGPRRPALAFVVLRLRLTLRRESCPWTVGFIFFIRKNEAACARPCLQHDRSPTCRSVNPSAMCERQYSVGSSVGPCSLSGVLGVLQGRQTSHSPTLSIQGTPCFHLFFDSLFNRLYRCKKFVRRQEDCPVNTWCLAAVEAPASSPSLEAIQRFPRSSGGRRRPVPT